MYLSGEADEDPRASLPESRRTPARAPAEQLMQKRSLPENRDKPRPKNVADRCYPAKKAKAKAQSGSGSAILVEVIADSDEDTSFS